MSSIAAVNYVLNVISLFNTKCICLGAIFMLLQSYLTFNLIRNITYHRVYHEKIRSRTKSPFWALSLLE
jgi:hypothetical protein